MLVVVGGGVRVSIGGMFSSFSSRVFSCFFFFLPKISQSKRSMGIRIAAAKAMVLV